MKAVNLIPNEQRRGASVGAGRSGGAAYAVLGVIAAVAVLAFLYGQAKHQVSSREGEAASLTARAQALQAQASSLAPYTSFLQLREARTKAVSSLVDTRFDWAHAFHEFGRVLPSDISVSSLDGTVGSGAAGGASPAASSASAASASSASAAHSSVTSATPAGSIPIFTMTGCATSQRAVAGMLQRLRLIDGVSEVTLQSSTKAGSGTGGSGTGGCTGSQPAFSVTISFDALPSESAAAAAVKTKGAGTATVAQTGAQGATGGAQ